MSKIVQLKDRLGTHEDEYPITLAKAVLMPDGVGNVADAIENARIVDDALSLTSNNPVANKIVTQAIANAGTVKDVTVDGVSVLDTTTGIAAITIPEAASLDLTTNKLTVGTTVLDNILTKADLDDNLADAANTAVTAATANAVVGFVGSLADIDSDGDGTPDAAAPTTVVAAINKVAANAGKIESVSINGTAVTIDAAKNVNIPAASSTVEGVVKITDTYSATGTEAITGKGIANAFATLTANDAAVAGQYVTSVTEANGTITVTRTDIPVQDVLVNSASIVGADHKVNLDTTLADYAKKADLKMAAEVGGANKVLTTVNEADGVVTATAVDAVVKDTTAATGDAYSYTIAGAATKVELPIATDTTFGEVKYDNATIGVNTDKQLIVKEPFQFLGDATATALNAANITTICENKVPADKTVTKNMIVSIYNADGIFLGQMLYDGLDWIVFMKSTPYTVTFM